MKRAFLMLAAVMIVAGLSGCCNDQMYCPQQGNGLAGGGRNARPCRIQYFDDNQCHTPGPASGSVAYPYYTVRGPRDFLVSNPPSIGP